MCIWLCVAELNYSAVSPPEETQGWWFTFEWCSRGNRKLHSNCRQGHFTPPRWNKSNLYCISVQWKQTSIPSSSRLRLRVAFRWRGKKRNVQKNMQRNKNTMRALHWHRRHRHARKTQLHCIQWGHMRFMSHMRAHDTRATQMTSAGTDRHQDEAGQRCNLLITPHHKLVRKTRQCLITRWLLWECLEFSLSLLHISSILSLSPSRALSFHISIFLSLSLSFPLG